MSRPVAKIRRRNAIFQLSPTILSLPGRINSIIEPQAIVAFGDQLFLLELTGSVKDRIL